MRGRAVAVALAMVVASVILQTTLFGEGRIQPFGASPNLVVLTVIATIFIPLTFVAGIYGMNFENMPELKWPLGYLFVWIIMIAIAAGMVLHFKKRKWL